MNDTVLRALNSIAGGSTADAMETDSLEFKTDGRSRGDAVKNLAEATACFANGNGGTIVVGVKDRTPGEDAFEGTRLDRDILQRRIYELTLPSITVQIDALRSHGADLLMIRVPRSPDVHQVEGRATRRLGASCEPMTATQIAALVSERRGEDWSAEDSFRPIQEVRPNAVERGRELLRSSNDPVRRAYATETDANLLRILGVVSPGGNLNRAGALLFAEPSDVSPSVVYQFRRTPAGEPVVNRPDGPLLPVLLRTLELISARLDTSPVNLPNGQQTQLADLPEPAIREAVANALMHRDYRLPAAVRIEHAPTRLTVTSPGPLVQGVTVGNILTTTSRPRNPRLAAAVRILGLAEEAGVGVDRMYREMVRIGHRPPEYEESMDQVRVTLAGGAPNRHLTRFVTTLPAEESDDADTMLVLYTLLGKRTTNAAQLVALLQKQEDEIESVLRRLAADSPALVEPTRETARRAHPNYRLREHVVAALGPAVAYRRRTTDEYDRKIVQLVQETGQINARIVKIALDLDTVPASRVLADLVDRDILVKTSQAQRGPSVTYGPGPKFPSRKRSPRTSTPVDGDDPTPLF